MLVIVCIRSKIMKVVLSEHNLDIKEGFEQVFNVSKIYMHNFNRRTFNNDIILIKVGLLQRITPVANKKNY